jgi:hypothetical protein
MAFLIQVFILTTNRDYILIHTKFDIMSHSAFIIFIMISSRHFLPFEIMSLSHSMFIRFYLIFSQHFLLFDVWSRSAFITFVLMSCRRYLQFDVFPIRRFFTLWGFFFRRFVPFDILSVDVFFFDILSVNQQRRLYFETFPNFIVTRYLSR